MKGSEKMSIVTQQTRQLSFEDMQLKKKIRYEQILNRLQNGKKTAKEIAVELFELKLIPSTERNYTAPRLTELEQMGLVKSTSKKKCQYTGKKVAIYEITTEGLMRCRNRKSKKGSEKHESKY